MRKVPGSELDQKKSHELMQGEAADLGEYPSVQAAASVYPATCKGTPTLINPNLSKHSTLGGRLAHVYHASGEIAGGCRCFPRETGGKRVAWTTHTALALAGRIQSYLFSMSKLNYLLDFRLFTSIVSSVRTFTINETRRNDEILFSAQDLHQRGFRLNFALRSDQGKGGHVLVTSTTLCLTSI